MAQQAKDQKPKQCVVNIDQLCAEFQRLHFMKPSNIQECKEEKANTETVKPQKKAKKEQMIDMLNDHFNDILWISKKDSNQRSLTENLRMELARAMPMFQLLNETSISRYYEFISLHNCLQKKKTIK